jgi:hypothetical protein
MPKAPINKRKEVFILAKKRFKELGMLKFHNVVCRIFAYFYSMSNVLICPCRELRDRSFVKNLGQMPQIVRRKIRSKIWLVFIGPRDTNYKKLLKILWINDPWKWTLHGPRRGGAVTVSFRVSNGNLKQNVFLHFVCIDKVYMYILFS